MYLANVCFWKTSQTIRRNTVKVWKNNENLIRENLRWLWTPPSIAKDRVYQARFLFITREDLSFIIKAIYRLHCYYGSILNKQHKFTVSYLPSFKSFCNLCLFVFLFFSCFAFTQLQGINLLYCFKVIFSYLCFYLSSVKIFSPCVCHRVKPGLFSTSATGCTFKVE